MNLSFYESFQKISFQNPNDYYRTHFQALLDLEWDNTTTELTIQQQQAIGGSVYNTIQVRMTHVLDRSTGQKQGDDFRKLLFQDIGYIAPKGLYYKFSNNYWLTINTDELNRISRHVVVRRCNNFIVYRCQYDNHLITIPCVMEYDTSSPSPQVNNDVITPNNHAVLIVQGNEETYTLIKDNLRLMYGNRPFKVTGYNNYLETDLTDSMPYLLYIDAYLDERSPYDTPTVAYNYPNDYSISIQQSDIEQITGYDAQLNAVVKDRGEIVSRDISWISSNSDVVTVDADGHILIVGNVGEQAIITAQLGQNDEIQDSITVTVVNELPHNPHLVLIPNVSQLSQGESIEFEARVVINGEVQSNKVTLIPSGADVGCYCLDTLGGNKFKLTNRSVSQIPLALTASSGDLKEVFVVELTSMF